MTLIARYAAIAIGLCAATALFANAPPVPKGGEDKSWVGKTVLPKKPGAIGSPATDAPLRGTAIVETTGKQLFYLEGASWEVKAEKGTRVEVIENGTAFWVDKDLLVPLADAIDFYTKAIKENEKDAHSHNFRGWAKYLLGKSDDAVKDFDSYLKLTPDPGAIPEINAPSRAIGLSNRGLVLAEMGKLDEALKDLDEAMKLGYLPALLNRGWAYELNGKYLKATEDYARLLVIAPNDLQALNNSAWLKATCPNDAFRDGKEAVKLAQEACKYTANREGGYLDTLAAAHAEAGDFTAAVKAQELAMEDVGYMRKYGDDAKNRLQLYKDKKPFRTEPIKPK